MRPPSERSNLRKQAELAYRRYRAILVLTNALTAGERKRLDRAVEILPTLPRPQLHRQYLQIKGRLADLERHTGAIGTLAEYERLLAREGAPPGTVLFLPKYSIQDHLFTKYGRTMPTFDLLPLHARIGLDTASISEVREPITWFLLEAKLFEDMALLWNTLLDSGPEPLSKWGEVLSRSTVRAGFNFLEGYLNGLAEEVLKGPDRHSLTSRDLEKLLEWSAARNRPQRLSLRDKILQYPRVALRATVPPMAERKSEAMDLIVRQVRKLRHPLVHPAPSSSFEAPELEGMRDAYREAVFFELRRDEVSELVDATIALVREIAALVGEAFGRIDLWLCARESTGRFPAKAFQ